MKMTASKIKALLSMTVLDLKDTPKERILRYIIFQLAENIDWQSVYEKMKQEMPEITRVIVE